MSHKTCHAIWKRLHCIDFNLLLNLLSNLLLLTLQCHRYLVGVTFTWASPLFLEISLYYSIDFAILWKIRQDTEMPEALSDSVNGTNTGVLTFLHTKQRDIADHVIVIFVVRSLNCSAEPPNTFVKHRSDCNHEYVV